MVVIMFQLAVLRRVHSPSSSKHVQSEKCVVTRTKSDASLNSVVNHQRVSFQGTHDRQTIKQKSMLKMKLVFVLIATACLIATVHCDSGERSLVGCFTGLNRCSEAVSWFSNLFLDSCNDYCVRGGSIGGACVVIPTSCQLRSERSTVRQCKCY